MTDKLQTTSYWSEPDWLGQRLEKWVESLPDWTPAEYCKLRVEQFTDRTSAMQKRLGMPLIVAFLGGTGTGKSTLINALLGKTIVREGKQRPTTDQPILVCRPEIDPANWGIDVSDIRVEKHDLPSLARTVFIDCPDPDTTENEKLRLSNLARLRAVLPLCDIIIVTGTQQKYRSRKVADELADAAPGARLLFVQTHADKDIDIREDWAEVLKDKYETGSMFFVDSQTAITEQLAGKEPSGEFGELYRLLTKDLNDESALRVRLANYFDLAEETTTLCREEIETNWPVVRKLQEKIEDERKELGLILSEKMRQELVQDRRIWETRLLDQITTQWGYSPFSIVLQTYQRLGSIVVGMALARARSIPQLVALGTVESVRSIRKWSDSKRVKEKLALENYWEENTLRESNLVLSGFARDAGIQTESIETVIDESQKAGNSFVQVISGELNTVIERLVFQHNTLFTRVTYETLVSVMLLFVLWRPAYNYFYESFFSGEIWPLSNYIVSIFWLLTWCLALLLVFLLSLNLGLQREINETSSNWSIADSMRQVFYRMDSTCDSIRDFREQLESLRQHIDQLNRQGQSLDKRLGRRK